MVAVQLLGGRVCPLPLHRRSSLQTHRLDRVPEPDSNQGSPYMGHQPAGDETDAGDVRNRYGRGDRILLLYLYPRFSCPLQEGNGVHRSQPTVRSCRGWLRGTGSRIDRDARPPPAAIHIVQQRVSSVPLRSGSAQRLVPFVSRHPSADRGGAAGALREAAPRGTVGYAQQVAGLQKVLHVPLAAKVVGMVGACYVRMFPGPELCAEPMVCNSFKHRDDLPVQRIGGCYSGPLWIVGSSQCVLPWGQLGHLGGGGYRGTFPGRERESSALSLHGSALGGVHMLRHLHDDVLLPRDYSNVSLTA